MHETASSFKQELKTLCHRAFLFNHLFSEFAHRVHKQIHTVYNPSQVTTKIQLYVVWDHCIMRFDDPSSSVFVIAGRVTRGITADVWSKGKKRSLRCLTASPWVTS
jgi:hypothetical protein